MTATQGTLTNPKTLEDLERRCRMLALVAWLGLLCAGFAVLVLALQRIGAESGKVRAQGFVLEDFTGRERAALDLFAGEGEVRLELRDPEGRARLAFLVDQGGMPQVHLRDQGGKVRLGLGVLPDGSPALSLNGADGSPRAWMRVEGEIWKLLVRGAADTEPFIVPAREGNR